jgi:hypothetical protein
MWAVASLAISILHSALALFRGRQEQAIVELALRRQLAVYAQRHRRPRLSPLDRAFWVALSRFSPGYLCHLLRNPIYIRRVGHHGASFAGQHPAIVDRKTWDAVQAQLAGHTRGQAARTRATEPSPLRGKLFDEEGAPLTPSHMVKSAKPRGDGEGDICKAGSRQTDLPDFGTY